MVVLLAPPSDGGISGGYLYNAMISKYAPQGSFYYQTVFSQQPFDVSLFEKLPQVFTHLILDSLFFNYPEWVKQIAEYYSGKLLFLVHYLPSESPRLSEEEKKKLRGYEDYCFQFCRAVIATGPSTVSALKKRGHVPDTIIEVTPGIDKKLLFGSKALSDEKSPLSVGSRQLSGNGNVIEQALSEVGYKGKQEKPLVFFSAMNWTREKNHTFLLDVLSELQYGAWVWIIAGTYSEDNNYIKQFKKKAEEMGLLHRIYIAGEISHQHVLACMKAAHVFLFPSLVESYGMAVAEAMAAGCSVVANDIEAVHNLISNKKEGLLCRPQDKGGWVRALKDLVFSPDKRRAIGKAAVKKSLSFPSWEETAEKFVRKAELV